MGEAVVDGVLVFEGVLVAVVVTDGVFVGVTVGVAVLDGVCVDVCVGVSVGLWVTGIQV